jgi:CheY-like chemotaxis protein
MHFALNGQLALDVLKEHPDVDMILSDINMPVMDGLTLLSNTKEQNPLIENRDHFCLRRYGKYPQGNESGCF